VSGANARPVVKTFAGNCFSARRGPLALQLGVTTYGYLYQRTLEGALRGIAAAGYTLVEISTISPHVYTPATGVLERWALRRILQSLKLRCVSINAAEQNLISPHPALREVALKEYEATIEFAADLEVDIVVVGPGRLNALIPMPENDAIALLKRQLERLLPRAMQLGVRLALETFPFGFMRTGAEVKAVVDSFADSSLGIAYDCANVLAHEDPAEGVRAIADRLLIAHLSDAWKDRFAHTSVGRGEVDFKSYCDALREAGFAGPSIYELVDGEDPDPRIVDDAKLFRAWGWQIG
jgi:sugar phosphate isomerase/epimerase